MINFIIILAIIVAATVFPVMISAKILGAENSTFKASLLAVIGSAIAIHVTDTFVANPGFSAVIGVALSSVFVSLALNTNYIKAVVISLLAFGIQFVLVAGMAGIGISAGVVDITT